MVKIQRNRRPGPPGEILKVLFMEQRNISVSSLAGAIDVSRKHMSRIMNGKARLKPAIAARLGKALGTSARIWVDLQAELDAWDAEKEARNWKPGRIFPAAVSHALQSRNRMGTCAIWLA
jgi:addiction module HigA family antidote